MVQCDAEYGQCGTIAEGSQLLENDGYIVSIWVHAGSDYSDVFGFFMWNKAGGTPQNVALLPNSSTPVSIATVNPNNNAFYLDNRDKSLATEMEGLTTVLKTVDFWVNAGVTYSIKIGELSTSVEPTLWTGQSQPGQQRPWSPTHPWRQQQRQHILAPAAIGHAMTMMVAYAVPQWRACAGTHTKGRSKLSNSLNLSHCCHTQA